MRAGGSVKLYRGQQGRDVVDGTTKSGRFRPQAESMIDIALACEMWELRRRAMTAADWLSEVDLNDGVRRARRAGGRGLTGDSAAWRDDRWGEGLVGGHGGPVGSAGVGRGCGRGDGRIPGPTRLAERMSCRALKGSAGELSRGWRRACWRAEPWR